MTDSDGTANTAETAETTIKSDAFLEYLKALAWCKQGDNTLVAVHNGTPEIIEQLTDHEVKVFPGGITVKMQKSVLSNFQTKYDEGQPLPVVIVWKSEGVEIWYRKVKPTEFPYDAWSDTTAAAYEQERVLIPSEGIHKDQGSVASVHKEIAGKVAVCPAMMPDY